ncbi:MAG: glucose-6-phosphate dehydrogenase, partial [Steroidobacteraceae bacterium]
MTKVPQGVGPSYPQVVILVGATGDLSKRKLLPGLFHLSNAGFIPGCRIIGVSLDELDVEGFREQMRQAVGEHSTRKINDADWSRFAQTLSYVPLTAGANALNAAVQDAERALGQESRRLHYLSVPPNAALSAVRMLGDAGLVDRSRVIMEKPFGTD